MEWIAFSLPIVAKGYDAVLKRTKHPMNAMKMRILPQSLWVAYTMVNRALIQDMIPDNVDIAPTKLLQDGDSREWLLFNAYTVESRWMRGQRVDIQVFTRDKVTQTPHLVILDVMTNTLDWNPIDGLRMPNSNVRVTDDCFRLVSSKGNFCVQYNQVGPSCELNWSFVVEANRVCHYRNSRGFSMSFSESALMQPVTNLTAVVHNNLWNHCRADTPAHVFAHPGAMSFDVDVAQFAW